jgi:hypothetical protein
MERLRGTKIEKKIERDNIYIYKDKERKMERKREKERKRDSEAQKERKT